MKYLLLLVPIWLAAVQDQPTPIRGLRHPALSPDGKTIAFTWHGDIWTVPTTGGRASRVTAEDADEQKPAWSPDGKQIAYSSNKNGRRDLYIIQLDRKESRRLTFHSADDDAPAWSPDGKWIAFESTRDPNVDLPSNDDWADIWLVPAEGGTPRRVTTFGGANPAWSEDGRWITFDRYASGYGDGEHDLFVVSIEGGIPRRLVAGESDSRHPVFKNGSIHFSQGSHGLRGRGVANLWRVAFEGGPVFQLTGFEDWPARWPSVSRESDLIVFESDYELQYLALRDSTSLKEKSARPRKIEVTVEGDPYQVSRSQRSVRTLSGGVKSPAWSPDGKWIVGSLESDLWLIPVEGGEAKRLTETVEEERDPSWTADGKQIVFVRGPYGLPGDVFMLPMAGGDARKLSRESGQYRAPRISGDGKWIACFVEGTVSNDLALLEADTGRIAQNLGSRELDESYPVFHARQLAYLRYGPSKDKSEIVLHDLDKGSDEVVYEESGACQYLDWSRDGGRFLYCRIDENGYSTPRTFDLKTKAITRVPRERGMSVHSPAFSPDGTRFVAEERKVLRGYEEDRTSDLTARPVESNAQGEAPATEIRFEAVRTLSHQDEMVELLHQGWGLYARSFYDPFFHGADWNKVRQRYSSLALNCETKEELYDLINDMIGELRASHVRLKPPEEPEKSRTYMLGIDYQVLNDGALQVSGLVEGGPADWAGIKKGDVIVKVAGKDLSSATDVDALTTFGADVLVTSLALELKGGRKVEVKALASADLRKLKYDVQIRRRRELVREKSKGRLAYHHMQFMNAAEVKRLQDTIELEVGDAEALVLDVRDGMGGLAHWQVLTLLDSRVRLDYRDKAVLYMRYRNGRVIPDVFSFNPIGGSVPDNVSLRKPVVLVQNEVSRSDKEILSYMFKAIGMGYRVGTPTAGGVIGGFPNRLADGSSVIVSVQGWFTKDGTNLEGYRVPPDFQVVQSLEDLHAGKDPQLEKAIDVMLAQLEGKLPAPRETK